MTCISSVTMNGSERDQDPPSSHQLEPFYVPSIASETSIQLSRYVIDSDHSVKFFLKDNEAVFKQIMSVLEQVPLIEDLIDDCKWKGRIFITELINPLTKVRVDVYNVMILPRISVQGGKNRQLILALDPTHRHTLKRNINKIIKKFFHH